MRKWIDHKTTKQNHKTEVYEMERYQICYTKGTVPMESWNSDKENAKKLADSLRKAGYTVQVWAHTKDGAHKTDL
jgi:hypothetical protein